MVRALFVLAFLVRSPLSAQATTDSAAVRDTAAVRALAIELTPVGRDTLVMEHLAVRADTAWVTIRFTATRAHQARLERRNGIWQNSNTGTIILYNIGLARPKPR